MCFKSRTIAAAGLAALLPLCALADAPIMAANAPAAQQAQAAVDGAALVAPSTPTRTRPAALWSAKRGSDLRDVLYDWTRRAGWNLVWESDYSYELQADASFDGDLVGALHQLFDALSEVNPPLFPEAFKGNRVLLVKNQPTR